jgi:hypothetical protein
MNALAMLRVWSVEVDVPGAGPCTIPATPAAGWMEAVLLGGERPDIIPGMLEDPEQLDRVHREIVNGRLDRDKLVELSRAALAETAGGTWWWACRLIAGYGVYPRELGSRLALDGIDVSARPLALVLAALHQVLIRDLPPDKRIALDLQLNAPPAGVETAEAYDAAEATRALIAAHGLPPMRHPAQA